MRVSTVEAPFTACALAFSTAPAHAKKAERPSLKDAVTPSSQGLVEVAKMAFVGM